MHRIGYPGGNYANLAALMPGYRGQILVFVDTRGNICITDKQWGMFILRYTGKGKPKATAK